LVVKAKPIPPRPPEDLATEQLVAAVESVIGAMQERLANLADDNQDAKWSVSDLVKLLQLRNQLQGERSQTVRAYWVDDPPRSSGAVSPSDIGKNHSDHPEPDTRIETYR
jgi:hypothetical protein